MSALYDESADLALDDAFARRHVQALMLPRSHPAHPDADADPIPQTLLDRINSHDNPAGVECCEALLVDERCGLAAHELWVLLKGLIYTDDDTRLAAREMAERLVLAYVETKKS